jgi:hypothetical protein
VESQCRVPGAGFRGWSFDKKSMHLYAIETLHLYAPCKSGQAVVPLHLLLHPNIHSFNQITK